MLLYMYLYVYIYIYMYIYMYDMSCLICCCACALYMFHCGRVGNVFINSLYVLTCKVIDNKATLTLTTFMFERRSSACRCAVPLAVLSQLVGLDVQILHLNPLYCIVSSHNQIET